MTAFKTLDLDITDGIATATFNRPDQMNTFNGDMADDLLRLFDLTDGNDDVGAVIITGSGRAFCAGADLSGKSSTFDYASRGRAAENHRDRGGIVTLRIFESLKPVIGAINGAAVGVGATMQLPMDIRLASDTARFGFVFARRGITPEAASSWFLPKLVGIQQALEWCYSGRVFNAKEALDGGLIRSVHPPEELLPAATALAQEIVQNTSPVSVALIRQMMWRLPSADVPFKAHLVDSAMIYARGGSDDAKEGVSAFVEKRPARFPGRVSQDMPEVFPWWEDPDTSA